MPSDKPQTNALQDALTRSTLRAMADTQTAKHPKWPWMAVFRVANGFIVRCGLGGPHASEAEYVFNDASEMGKWISQHAGDK